MPLPSPPSSAKKRGQQGIAALRASATAAWRVLVRSLDPEHNPFLAAELRIQARQRSLPRNLLLQALALGLLFFGLLALARWPGDEDPQYWQRWLAQHLFVGVAALHVWLIIHASDSRARQAAQREETARMWEMLLVTPLAPREIVLFKSVYPFLYAGLIALVGLPMYLLSAAMGEVTPGLLLSLYGVYGLLMLRLVAPLPPRTVERKGGRRPRHAANLTGNLVAMFWVLPWVGRALAPVTPLAWGMILTWPVVLAIVLPVPFGFFRSHLPPLVVLLVLGPPLFALSLDWASHRLVTHANETAKAATGGLLRRAVLFGGALVVQGYTWPRLVEMGTLGQWLQMGSQPEDSVAPLVWLLLATWWLLFGLGGLLSLPAEPAQANGTRPPRFWSGWMEAADRDRSLLPAVISLVLPPLLLAGTGCMLTGRFPPAVALPWLGRVVVVAVGAATLTVVLARRIREAMESDRMEAIVAGWVLAVALLVAPLLLTLWPELTNLRVAAVSPVMGFLALLPSTTFSSSSAVLASAAPWWLSPALNLGAALLLARRRKVTGESRPVWTLPARPEDGLLSRWVERLAVRWEDPVLVRELRAGARRGPGRQWLAKAVVVAAVLLLVVAFSPRLIEGIVESFPIRMISDVGGDAGPRRFFEALMAVTILVLSGPMVLTAPVLGAVTFSGERRKGTLGFLLATPLREPEMTRGKLLGALAPLLLTLALTFPLAAVAAGLTLRPAAVWTLFFGYTWLLVACLTGGAFGMLASLVWPSDNDPQAPPLLAMMLLQAAKLYLVARLQLALTGASWVTGKLAITAWYVIPLVAVEAGLGLLAYTACVALLARARRRDLRFVTEK